MNQWNVVSPCNGIPCCCSKERNTDTGRSMDEPQKHYANWKKLDTKDCVLWDFAYMKLLEKGKTTETESRSAVAWVGSRSRYQLQLSRGKFWGDGAVLQLDCGDGCTITTVTKSLQTAHLESVSFYGDESFHSNPKERQRQRLLKLLHNCTHLTC